MRSVILAVLFASLTSSCGEEESCGEHSHDPACMACSGDEDEAAPGTRKTGEDGVFAIELVAASPQTHGAPNELTVLVEDADGNPVDGATFAFELEGNGHGSPTVPQVAAGTNPGEYVWSDVTYLEPVPYTVTVTVTAGGVSDVVIFELCVEE